jgi:hypothetical protein
MVKTHHWRNDMLEAYEHFFDSFDDAKAFADVSDANSLKIYDENGALLHEATPEQNSYA